MPIFKIIRKRRMDPSSFMPVTRYEATFYGHIGVDHRNILGAESAVAAFAFLDDNCVDEPLINANLTLIKEQAISQLVLAGVNAFSVDTPAFLYAFKGELVSFQCVSHSLEHPDNLVKEMQEEIRVKNGQGVAILSTDDYITVNDKDEGVKKFKIRFAIICDPFPRKDSADHS